MRQTKSRTLQAFLLAVVAIASGGCAITIQQPANNATVTLPSKAKVLVTGNGSYTGLHVMVDGVDVSSQMVSTGPRSNEGDIGLASGSHTVSASAEVACWYCAGGKTQSTDTKSFIVSGPQVCARSGGLPITLPPSFIEGGQRPGQQRMGYRLQNNWDTLLIVVDDAPGLKRTQMRVQVDIDPFNKVTWGKAIEAWGLCHVPRVDLVEVSMLPGINAATACAELTPANDFRSGCTSTQSMLLDQSTTHELWLRKPGWFGVWGDVEGIDDSIWQAFGGRSVRFIWRRD